MLDVKFVDHLIVQNKLSEISEFAYNVLLQYAKTLSEECKLAMLSEGESGAGSGETPVNTTDGLPEKVITKVTKNKTLKIGPDGKRKKYIIFH